MAITRTIVKTICPKNFIYLGFNQIPEPEYVFFEESGRIFHFDVEKTAGAPIVQHPIDSVTPEKFEIRA